MQKTKDANDSPKIFSNQRKQSRCGLVFDLHFGSAGATLSLER